MCFGSDAMTGLDGGIKTLILSCILHAAGTKSLVTLISVYPSLHHMMTYISHCFTI